MTPWSVSIEDSHIQMQRKKFEQFCFKVLPSERNKQQIGVRKICLQLRKTPITPGCGFQIEPQMLYPGTSKVGVRQGVKRRVGSGRLFQSLSELEIRLYLIYILA